MKNEHIQAQQIPPDIPYNDPNAMRKVIDLAKSTAKKQYELEERIEKIEKFFAESRGRI